MKSFLVIVAFLAFVLVVSGCTQSTDNGVDVGGNIGDPCTDKYDCNFINACGAETPICQDEVCACPSDQNIGGFITNNVVCTKEPNAIWKSCSDPEQREGYFFNTSSQECYYYEGLGCSPTPFEMQEECEFTCM